MLSNLIDDVEDYLKSNTEEKSNEYTEYPSMSSSKREATENINNFIGTFCPQGHYYVKKNGMIDIQPSTVPITSTSRITSNLSNFNTETNIENFGNFIENIKNCYDKEQIFIVLLFICIIVILILKKLKLLTI
jgi:hypothetical protein